MTDREFPQIMTIADVAEYLGLHELTVRRLAREGAIPALKLGRQWRIKRDLLEQWIENRSLDNAVDSGPGTGESRAAARLHNLYAARPRRAVDGRADGSGVGEQRPAPDNLAKDAAPDERPPQMLTCRCPDTEAPVPRADDGCLGPALSL